MSCYFRSVLRQERATMDEGEVLLRLSGITKRFPGVLALESVEMDVRAGDVHGLTGENGAGKSTLIKILAGAYAPDQGEILFNGKRLSHMTPLKAMSLGIACIYQELNLIPHLTVVENIFLGRELYLSKALGILDRRRMLAEAVGLLHELQLSLDPRMRTGDLGVGHQQMVEICKAVHADAKLIIMDEPTSSLSEHEAEDLFRIIAQVKAKGVTVIFISHRLDEVKRICDRVTVLRDGHLVATRDIADASVDEIIRLMVGRDIVSKYPKGKRARGEEALSVEGLERRGVLHGISFKAYKGEILGFAGLVGAGRTETARAITGADPIDSGVIRVMGRETRIRTPRDSIDAGIAFLTEDRKSQGLILIKSVSFNSSLVRLERYTRLGFLRLRAIRAMTEKMALDLQLRAPSVDTEVGQLSGGNQQKVVIAKWLLTKAKIFIFDEPTRGIDVGAKVEVYNLMNELVAGGAAVIIICSEMDEVMGMADRILVMHEGRITAEFSQAEATQENILYAASGLTDPAEGRSA
jgi:ribose transport system ATP-binding protein